MIFVSLWFQMSVALLTLVILSIVLECPLLCQHLLNVRSVACMFRRGALLESHSRLFV